MPDSEKVSVDRGALLRMTAEIASAYVGKSAVPAQQLPGLIESIYATISSLDTAAESAAGQKPAVPVKKSITAEYIICLEDGKKLKMLKRHLRTHYSLTPEQYRAKWGLSPDYPMVAPNYAAQRSAFAKKIGLGRKPGARKGARKK